MPSSIPPGRLAPAESLARLREGNERFVRGAGEGVRNWHPALRDGQRPFAAVLGCADSRSPAEYVFDQGLGDLFVVRVAGNIVAPSLVGSLEFAVGEFGTRLVVVMGHTFCGAVGATVDALEHGASASPNIRAIVERIEPHVRHLFEGPGDPDARLAAAVRVNALASASDVRDASPLLHDLAERGEIVIVAAVYDVGSGVVSFLDSP